MFLSLEIFFLLTKGTYYFVKVQGLQRKIYLQSNPRALFVSNAAMKMKIFKGKAAQGRDHSIQAVEKDPILLLSLIGASVLLENSLRRRSSIGRHFIKLDSLVRDRRCLLPNMVTTEGTNVPSLPPSAFFKSQLISLLSFLTPSPSSFYHLRIV